ncbi:putative MYND domain protein [Dactylonectria macrodidyma]|uniref:MYND domain protein n=1 Tax=Dactylonectria macrodidyma TaxID=307937 RepID=A0A9P9IDC5_9HYPO|nr:putative MYND domain protein [Dactylonectria macrodidyma]
MGYIAIYYRFCSRDCQKADWKAHKKICSRQADATTSVSDGATTANLSPPKGLEQGVACPFTRLDNSTWLHDRSEKDVYGLLIDAYRLCVEDIIYGGAANGLYSFQRFLERVVACPGLLPAYMTPSQWYDLQSVMHKSDIIKNYGNSRFPTQLRIFAEAVYVQAPGGTNGTAMRQMMVAMEQGRAGGMHSHIMDMSPAMFGRR